MGGVLVYNEDAAEAHVLGDLLRAGGVEVFTTGRVLEAVHILKNEEIGIVLTSNLGGIEAEEFKALVEGARPGAGVVFIGSVAGKDISLSADGFRSLLSGPLRTETEMRRQARELKEFFFAFADKLLQIFEAHDRYFFNNNHLVAELSRKIARKMGLSEETVEAVWMAALLRDIGKVGIQQQLIEERKRLDSRELVPIKSHPLYTVEILKQIRFPWDVDSIIAQHHEHYDGTGYPVGLKGRQIAVGARIIGIADSYYAMTTDRPYRKALPKEMSLQEIKKKAGSQFDPEVTEAFLDALREEAAAARASSTVLVLEREPTMAALLRLSADTDRVHIEHAPNSFDAMHFIRQKQPDIVVADVETLDREAFARFQKVVLEMPAARGRHFIFVVPEGYPRQFEGGNIHYAQKPVDITALQSEINDILAAEPAPRISEEPRGLTGALEDFDLTDIVQILHLGLKTARVGLDKQGEKGVIYVRHGKVVHASTSASKGNGAFFEMLDWKTGAFHILHGQTAPGENITMDTIHLLLEGARLFDEKRAGRASRPADAPRGR